MNASLKHPCGELENGDNCFRGDRMGKSLFSVSIFMLSATIYQKAFDNQSYEKSEISQEKIQKLLRQRETKRMYFRMPTMAFCANATKRIYSALIT